MGWNCEWYSTAGYTGDNQDAVAFPIRDKASQLFAVIDGIGGCPMGGELARWLGQQLSNFPHLDDAEAFDDELDRLWDDYQTLGKDPKNGEKLLGSGAAVSMLLFNDPFIHLRHAGDTTIRQCSGHNIALELAHPDSDGNNGLYNYFGNPPPVQWYSLRLTAKPKNRYILASDGISSYLTPKDIHDIAIACDWQFDRLAEFACEMARGNGSQDDQTIMLVRHSDQCQSTENRKWC